MKKIIICMTFIPCISVSNAWSANGINLIGFGVESSAMGGADLAVSRDTFALNINPAGLSQIADRQLDLYAGLAVFHASHSDQLQGHVTSGENVLGSGQFGYAWKSADGVMSYGVGLFAQAGAGADYTSVKTVFATTDNAFLQVAAAKLQAGASLRVNDKLSIGASLALVSAKLDQAFFPNTSFISSLNPSQVFFGTQLKDMDALSFGMKFGLMYKVSTNIRIGLAYTSKSRLEFKNGQFITNMSAVDPQLQNVNYRDVSFKGMDLPQEWGAGIAWQVNNKLLLAADISQIAWSDSMKETVLVARNPDKTGVPVEIRQNTALDWRNQIVYAIGLAYKLNERFLIRAGYNRGSNPVPSQTLNPLLGAIGEDHITLGIGYRINKQWRIDSGVEYQLENDVTYTNPDLPFGVNSNLELRTTLLHFQVSRRW